MPAVESVRIGVGHNGTPTAVRGESVGKHLKGKHSQARHAGKKGKGNGGGPGAASAEALDGLLRAGAVSGTHRDAKARVEHKQKQENARAVGEEMRKLGVTKEQAILAIKDISGSGTSHGRVAFEDGVASQKYGEGPFPARHTEVEQFAAGVIKVWSVTAGDSDTVAVQVQQAINTEFKLKADTGHFPDVTRSRLHPDTTAVLRKFARATYNDTQRKLKDAPDEITLVRGIGGRRTTDTGTVSVSFGKPAGRVDVDTVRANYRSQPATSWSTSAAVAMDFAYPRSGSGLSSGVVIGHPVKKKNILSTWATGVGCKSEKEVVVLDSGSRRSVGVKPSASWAYSDKDVWQALTAAGEAVSKHLPNKHSQARHAGKKGKGSPSASDVAAAATAVREHGRKTGNEQARVLGGGGSVLVANGGASTVDLTPEMVDQVAGGPRTHVFMHNHPRQGGSFSSADLGVLSVMEGLKSVDAVDLDGNHFRAELSRPVAEVNSRSSAGVRMTTEVLQQAHDSATDRVEVAIRSMEIAGKITKSEGDHLFMRSVNDGLQGAGLITHTVLARGAKTQATLTARPVAHNRLTEMARSEARSTLQNRALLSKSAEERKLAQEIIDRTPQAQAVRPGLSSEAEAFLMKGRRLSRLITLRDRTVVIVEGLLTPFPTPEQAEVLQNELAEIKARAVTKHLPNKHSQARHAGKKGKGDGAAGGGGESEQSGGGSGGALDFDGTDAFAGALDNLEAHAVVGIADWRFLSDDDRSNIEGKLKRANAQAVGAEMRKLGVTEKQAQAAIDEISTRSPSSPRLGTGQAAFANGAGQMDSDASGKPLGTKSPPIDKFASGVIKVWSDSASNNDIAVALQKAISAEFGLGTDTSNLKRRREPLSGETTAVLQKFARATYNDTQHRLRDAPDRITLMRGIGGSRVTETGTIGISVPPRTWKTKVESVRADYQSNPATSWSTDMSVVLAFSGGSGVIVGHSHRKTDILSTWATGVGCKPEAEVLILGRGIRRSKGVRLTDDLMNVQVDLQPGTLKTALSASAQGEATTKQLDIHAIAGILHGMGITSDVFDVIAKHMKGKHSQARHAGKKGKGSVQEQAVANAAKACLKHGREQKAEQVHIVFGDGSSMVNNGTYRSVEITDKMSERLTSGGSMAVVMHNHPKKSSLSPADLMMQVKHKMSASTHAVSSGGTHYMAETGSAIKTMPTSERAKLVKVAAKEAWNSAGINIFMYAKGHGLSNDKAGEMLSLVVNNGLEQAGLIKHTVVGLSKGSRQMFKDHSEQILKQTKRAKDLTFRVGKGFQKYVTEKRGWNDDWPDFNKLVAEMESGSVTKSPSFDEIFGKIGTGSDVSQVIRTKGATWYVDGLPPKASESEREAFRKEVESIKAGTVGKRYNPGQPRDDKGRWMGGSRGRAGGRQAGGRQGAAGGEQRTTVGITSARPAGGGGDVASRDVFTRMQEFGGRLQQIKSVRDAEVKPALGAWKGGSEPAWSVSYKGDGEARKLAAEYGQRYNQDAVLISAPATRGSRNGVTMKLSFDRGVGRQQREQIGEVAAANGMGGWTWQKDRGQTVLKLTSVQQWGGDAKAHTKSTAVVSRALSKLGHTHSVSSQNVKTEVLDGSNYNAVLGS